jgi:parallel beta-helix repeat protein
MEKTTANVLVLEYILLFSLVGTLFYMEPCTASPTTLYVDESNVSGPWNGTQEFPYRTIQSGIENASSGDTVYVYSGKYYENIEINKDISIVGESRDDTIIDGLHQGPVISANGPNPNTITVNINSFTIKNAGNTGNDCVAFSYVEFGTIDDNIIQYSEQSSGIQLSHCNEITISNNHISYNQEQAGLFIIHSDNCIINGNTIQYNQEGISFSTSSDNNKIYDNSITKNFHYGVYFDIGFSENNLFYENYFIDNNKGANARDPHTNIWNNNGRGNYWDNYGGVDENPKDGIGDTPYSIPGGGGNTDEYPLGYFQESDPPVGENQKPIALINSISPNPASYGQRVTFLGSGLDNDGFIAGYNWRSNIDGTLSDLEEFSTSTLSSGTHTIYFAVKDEDGMWSTEQTASLIITSDSNVNQEPSAIIDSITPNPAEEGEIVEFIGHGTDSDGSVSQVRWISSKDGIISSEASFNSSQLRVGTHTIYFQVADDDSKWSKQVTTTLIINEKQCSTNQKPISNASGPYTAIVHETILFDGTQSYDLDGEITAYLWDFNDGATSTEESPSHSYSSPGNYTITLMVTDDKGETAMNSANVAIYASSDQTENVGESSGFQIELPFPLVIAVEVLAIVSVIILFLWRFSRG